MPLYFPVRSRHSPALPHLKVPHAEVVPQWDDDEEGVQGSEVSGGHSRLHPPAAGGPGERAALPGGGPDSGCESRVNVPPTEVLRFVTHMCECVFCRRLAEQEEHHRLL